MSESIKLEIRHVKIAYIFQKQALKVLLQKDQVP